MQNEEKLKDFILDSIGEGVFTVDKNFRINYFNNAAEKITGYKREEVINKICKKIFKSHNCCIKCPLALVIEKDDNVYDFESDICCKSGDKKLIRLNSSILRNESGEPIGGVVAFREVTDIEQFKREIEKDTQFYGIVGHSLAMQQVFELIEEISETDAPVLIQGESGTGKEMIANAIQLTSNRRDKAYIKVNCSVFPEALLASELFGHVKGAFTDAIKDRIGRFELAHGGTLFLDEIGEIPLQMQVKLLRVLQEGTFERVGDSATRKADVRVIAATNSNLETAIKEGRFRDDLFYRLNVIPIKIPPLRERREDIPHLIRHFLKKFSVVYKKEEKEIEPEAVDVLMKYSFPGNIRELENILEFMFIRTGSGQLISAVKLPPHLLNQNPGSGNHDHFPDGSFNYIDKKAVVDALEKNKWKKSAAAKELGVSRTTLWRLMKQLDLN